jgi:hypothetical protein
MASINSNHDLFDYHNDNNDETVSLVGSYISSYNNMDNNIQDLVNVINSNGKSLKKQNSPSCNLSTIKESNLNVSPNDSISNIGNTNNDWNSVINIKNELENINNNKFDHINIDDSISKFSSVIQPNNPNNSNNSNNPNNNMKITHSKSVFDTNNTILPHTQPTIITSIFDNNKNITHNLPDNNLPDNNTFIGGADPGFKYGLLIALFLVALFCFIGVSCSYFNSNIIYTFAFVSFIGIAILFIDHKQIK